VAIDQGEGSAATVTKVMAGAYHAGFGDVNAIVQNAAAKPGQAPVMVYMLYNRAPFALIVKSSSPIKTPKDLEGRTLGSPAGGAAARMFPLIAGKNGVDATKVKWTNVAPNLQEQMLLKDHVEGAAVFSVTSYMNLVAQGVDPDKDIRWFHYGDHGVDLYGNGVMVSQQLVKDKPEAVAGLVRAVNKAVRDTIADPDAAIAALMKREPLAQQGPGEAAPAVHAQDRHAHARGRGAGPGRRERCAHDARHSCRSRRRSTCSAPTAARCSTGASCRRWPSAESP
jgi:NitT/TauT family transport system substrate-binding protein